MAGRGRGGSLVLKREEEGVQVGPRRARTPPARPRPPSTSTHTQSTHTDANSQVNLGLTPLLM
jgi:hypothetical protein